eukprot:189019-Pelagomonas_calceolata.AAC.1
MAQRQQTMANYFAPLTKPAAFSQARSEMSICSVRASRDACVCACRWGVASACTPKPGPAACMQGAVKLTPGTDWPCCGQIHSWDEMPFAPLKIILLKYEVILSGKN